MLKIAVLSFLLLCVSFAKDITDMSGYKVTVPDKIERVYASAPPMMMLVYLLDPDKLVASSYTTKMASSKYLDERFTKLTPISGWHGGTNGANMESLLSLKPQLVLAWKNGFVMRGAEENAKKFNIPILFVQEDAVEDEPAAIRFVGGILGVSQKAEKLAADAQKRLDYVKQVAAKVPNDKKPTVYYTTDNTGLTTQCSNSFHVAAMKSVGAKLAFECKQSSMGGAEQVTMERILEANPDVIISYDAGFVKNVYTDSRWGNIKAVKNKKVYLSPRDPVNFLDRPPSFMRILGVEWLASVLYPNEYKKDILGQVVSFYRMYLRRNITRSEAAKILGK